MIPVATEWLTSILLNSPLNRVAAKVFSFINDF